MGSIVFAESFIPVSNIYLVLIQVPTGILFYSLQTFSHRILFLSFRCPKKLCPRKTRNPTKTKQKSQIISTHRKITKKIIFAIRVICGQKKKL